MHATYTSHGYYLKAVFILFRASNCAATIRGQRLFEGGVYIQRNTVPVEKATMQGRFMLHLRHIWVVSSDIGLMITVWIFLFEAISELQRESLCHSCALKCFAGNGQCVDDSCK